MEAGNAINPNTTGSSKDKETSAEQGFYVASEPKDTSSNKKASVSREVSDISWEASEYVDHEKSVGWYLVLAGVAAAVAGLIFLVTDDIVTTFVVVVAAILFGVVASNRPRTLVYAVGDSGITIGTRLHSYAELKTFSVVADGQMRSIQLLPLKRFMPPLSVYFPPDQEKDIVERLGQFLPYEEHGHDAFDRLMSKIRF